MSTLRTDAWLLRGISSIPGELALRGGSLVFTAFNTGSAWPWQLRKLEREVGASGIAAKIDAGERTTVFRWPVAEVDSDCPWYYFGGGLRLRRGGVVLKFSFGRPANTRSNTLADLGDNLAELSSMRKRGRMWQSALEKSRGRSP
jgi:hypothetical protein